MANPYIGTIAMFAGTFAPVNWAFCNGALMPISQYDTLYTLIGTTYGGDGVNTFALPDLRSRIMVHQGTSVFGTTYVLGQSPGVESVNILAANMPNHTHSWPASNSTGSGRLPVGNVLGAATINAYQSGAPALAMAASTRGNAGGNVPHDNIMPYTAISFIISLFGIFPTQN